MRHVLAVSTLDYSTVALPPVRTLSNVFIANSAQIANGTLNVNETIGLANTSSVPRHTFSTSQTRGPLRLHLAAVSAADELDASRERFDGSRQRVVVSEDPR